MPDGLYDHDFVAWVDQQADTLERLARGERVNEAVDWPHLIDEVRDLARSQVNACESLLVQAFIHLLKLRLSADEQAFPHWRQETATFLRDATRRFSPSMRQLISLDELFNDALSTVKLGGLPVSETVAVRLARCPFAWDELLSTRPDIDALLSRFPG